MSYFLAFCLALCWGTAFLFSKNIVDVLPPYWGAFYRVLAGFLFFAVLFGVQRAPLKCPLRQSWRPATISFLLILLPFAALSWGLQYTAPTIGGIFNGTVPIWSFIFGAILLKGIDRFTWRRAIGVLIGLVGLLVIMQPQLQSALQAPAGKMALLGYAALLVMALSYGLGNVLTKKIMVDNTELNWQANTFFQYLFAAAALLLISLALEPIPPLGVFTTKVIFSIACVGIFSSAVAFLLMVALIRRWGATRMASVTYFTPIIAMGTDILFRGRIPHGAELVGLVLIFTSLWLIQKKVEA